MKSYLKYFTVLLTLILILQTANFAFLLILETKNSTTEVLQEIKRNAIRIEQINRPDPWTGHDQLEWAESLQNSNKELTVPIPNQLLDKK